MRITDLLDINSISLDAAPKSKNETLDQAVALMVKSGRINNEEEYRKTVYAREEESTTGIGAVSYTHLVFYLEWEAACFSLWPEEKGKKGLPENILQRR